jgi:DNA processing protein
VLTEYPIGTEPLPGHFPVRNRIMSGLGMGVCVVQAPHKSGALITVRHAAEQGREVFAVPGEIYDPKMEGCNDLIQDGAKLSAARWIFWRSTYRCTAIRSGLSADTPAFCRIRTPGRQAGQKPPPDRRRFLPKISRPGLPGLADGASSADAVAESTDVEIAQVLSALTGLEILGLAEPLPGEGTAVFGTSLRLNHH